MKKIFLTSLTLVSILFNGYSQEYFAKGSNIITGRFNIGSSDSEYDSDDGTAISESQTLGFSTNYGRFIKKNLVVGVGFGYSKRNNTYERNYSDSTFNHDISKSKTFSSEIFLRKYFPINEKFGAYLNSTIFYRLSDNSRTTIDEISETKETETTSNGFGISGRIGLYYFVLNKFSLSLNIGYVGVSTSSEKSKYDNQNNFQNRKSSSVQANFVNQISFDQLLTVNYHF